MTPLVVGVMLLGPVACGDDDTDSAAPAPSTTDVPVVDDGEEWVAFQGVSLGFTLARSDGSGEHVILDELPGDQLHPDWSPDGSQLAFVQASDDATWDVWVAEVNGEDAHALVEEYPAELDGLIWDTPAWSRDGTRIAMVGYVGNPNVELPTSAVLAIVEVATGRLTVAGEFPFDGPHAGLSFPRWSPDGDRLAVTLGQFDESGNLTGGAVAVLTESGDTWSEPAPITSYGAFADRPDWHPSEDLIVFTTYDIGGYESTDEPSNLFTVRPDGTELAPITEFPAGGDRATQPTWTADGRILFTHVTGPDDADRTIAVIEAGGTGLETLIEADAVGPFNRPHARMRPA